MTQLSLPQNGLRVGKQIVADGDNLSLGHDVGVENNLRVGNTVFANRIAMPYVTKNHDVTNTSLVIDCNYSKHNVTLCTNPIGITFTNVPSPQDGNFTVTVYLNQDIVGGRSITWPTNIKWPNTGSTPSSPVLPLLQTFPFKVDVFEFTTFDGGSTWIGCQTNPVQMQNADLASIQYAVAGSAKSIPSPSASGLLPTQTGSVVQVRTAINPNILTFGSSSSTPIDVVTMTFVPKYKTSRLFISGMFTTSASGTYPADFSVRGHFTLGTTPIPTGLLLSGSGNLFYYDVYPNQVDRQQVAHFGGYYYGMNSNFHINRTGQIYYDHGAEAGTPLDIRIRAVHADAWSTRSCSIGTSWTGTSNGNGSYTVQVPSTLTIMEILP